MRIYLPLIAILLILFACNTPQVSHIEMDPGRDTVSDVWEYPESKSAYIKVVSDPDSVLSFCRMVGREYAKIRKPVKYGMRRAATSHWGRDLPPIKFDRVVNDFVAAGLFTERPQNELIERMDEEAGGDINEFISELLRLAEVQLCFDINNTFPVEYDALLDCFVEKSDGVLKGMTVFNNVEHAGTTCKYIINVCYRGYGFVSVLTDEGNEWYDMGMVNALLDTMLARSGSNKRFVQVNTGNHTARFIFGEPVKVGWLIDKYHLEDNDATSDLQMIERDVLYNK